MGGGGSASPPPPNYSFIQWSSIVVVLFPDQYSSVGVLHHHLSERKGAGDATNKPVASSHASQSL